MNQETGVKSEAATLQHPVVHLEPFIKGGLYDA